MSLFLLGLLIGMLVPISATILLAWLLLRGGNRHAAGKLLHGLALLLAEKPPAPELSPDGNPEESVK